MARATGGVWEGGEREEGAGGGMRKPASVCVLNPVGLITWLCGRATGRLCVFSYYRMRSLVAHAHAGGDDGERAARATQLQVKLLKHTSSL